MSKENYDMAYKLIKNKRTANMKGKLDKLMFFDGLTPEEYKKLVEMLEKSK